MRAASGGADSAEGVGHPLLLGQLDEGGHLAAGEPDEVKSALSPSVS